MIFIAILLILILYGLLKKFHIEIIYKDEKISVRVGYLKFSEIVYSNKKINKKSRSKTPKKDKQKLNLYFIKRVKELITSLYPYIRKILSKISLKSNINLYFGTGDPYNTAILYGILNSVSYGIFAALNSLFKDTDFMLSAKPNMKEKQLSIDASIHIWIRLINIVPYILQIYSIFIRFMKKLKTGGDKNGTSY